MAKLYRMTQANFIRILFALPIFLVISGCDLDSDSVFEKSNDYVHHYAKKTKEFYVNNGFDERSARAMAVLYNALYKTRYDRQFADDSDLIENFHDVTFQEAKNIFACSIFYGRALQAVNHKAEIKEQVDRYMFLISENVRMSKEILGKGGKREDVDKAFKEKHGAVIDRVTIDRFFTITGFGATYEACAYQNIKGNYLSRPEAQQID